MACDNDYWERSASPCELCLHSEPVHMWHVQIENDAIGQAPLDRLQKSRTGAERLSTEAGGTHQTHQRFASGFFVVDNSNVRPSFGHNSARVRQPSQPAQLDLMLLSFRLLYFGLLYLRLLYFRPLYFRITSRRGASRMGQAFRSVCFCFDLVSYASGVGRWGVSCDAQTDSVAMARE